MLKDLGLWRAGKEMRNRKQFLCVDIFKQIVSNSLRKVKFILFELQTQLHLKISKFKTLSLKKSLYLVIYQLVLNKMDNKVIKKFSSLGKVWRKSVFCKLTSHNVFACFSYLLNYKFHLLPVSCFSWIIFIQSLG